MIYIYERDITKESRKNLLEYIFRGKGFDCFVGKINEKDVPDLKSLFLKVQTEYKQRMENRQRYPKLESFLRELKEGK